MRRFAVLFSLVVTSLSILAQGIDDVTLVVSGDGTTKEEATHVALRSAVEQAYGVFVSANTEILNDELVKDEIATVTSGNIKSFKELSSVTLPNGNQFVTLQAVVSTKNLASFAQSKGASCEFAGATFGANLKLAQLNQENTKKAFEHMLVQLKSLVPDLFDRHLTASPSADGRVKFKIQYKTTETTRAFYDIIYSTSKALNIGEEERQMLGDLGIKVYDYTFEFYKYGSYRNAVGSVEEKWSSINEHFVFYSEFPEGDIYYMLLLAQYAYTLFDNLGNEYCIYVPDKALYYLEANKDPLYKVYRETNMFYKQSAIGLYGDKRGFFHMLDLRPIERYKGLFSSKKEIVYPEVGDVVDTYEFCLNLGTDKITKITGFELKERKDYTKLMINLGADLRGMFPIREYYKPSKEDEDWYYNKRQNDGFW